MYVGFNAEDGWESDSPTRKSPVQQPDDTWDIVDTITIYHQFDGSFEASCMSHVITTLGLEPAIIKNCKYKFDI